MDVNNLNDDQIMSMALPDREANMVSKNFRVAHLTSEKGKKMNGKKCTVFGVDHTEEARLHCKIIDTGETMKLKNVNLQAWESRFLDGWMRNNDEKTEEGEVKYNLSFDDAKPLLIRMLQNQAHARKEGRQDVNKRYQDAQKLIKAITDAGEEGIKAANNIQCQYLGTEDKPFHELDSLQKIMRLMRPACVGDNTVDFRRFDLGLRWDGITECAVCHQEVMRKQDQNVITLPCFHVFHARCATQWAEQKNSEPKSCPTCSIPMKKPLLTYHPLDYDDKLEKRFDEFVLSGMCEKCQIWYQERDQGEACNGDSASSYSDDGDEERMRYYQEELKRREEMKKKSKGQHRSNR